MAGRRRRSLCLRWTTTLRLSRSLHLAKDVVDVVGSGHRGAGSISEGAGCVHEDDGSVHDGASFTINDSVSSSQNESDSSSSPPSSASTGNSSHSWYLPSRARTASMRGRGTKGRGRAR